MTHPCKRCGVPCLKHFPHCLACSRELNAQGFCAWCAKVRLGAVNPDYLRCYYCTVCNRRYLRARGRKAAAARWKAKAEGK